jgi:hypothetical protein
MTVLESATGIRGMFHDVLRDADGRVVWDRGWQKNVIVADARRLLATFLHGSAPAAIGIKGVQVGAGLPAWDSPPGPPTPTASQAALVNPLFTLAVGAPLPAGSDLRIEYLKPASEDTTKDPTNRLQIFARFGPDVPPATQPITLREFGLVGELDGTDVLINYRTHQAIAKDPTSALERTIWLVL